MTFDAALIERLEAVESDFAQSLCSQYRRRGSLSEKQWLWVRRLTNDIATPKAECSTSLERVVSMFDRAAEHLKFPKITIEIDAGKLVLQRAGERAKQPGSVNVKFNGEWAGRINRDGTMFGSRRIEDEDGVKAISEMLERFAADPEGVASEYGAASGRCCFCHKKLSDDRSKAVGYGPVCAENFGLGWGKQMIPIEHDAFASRLAAE